ncbi:MAG: MBL fold metallo-hydrolase [Nitrospinae bacterium]|nr:MBL fold metallo-hydrolase [Nitrospinota bacterium]
MRIRIHRGTNEIGGTCVEIEHDGQRIVLDIGLPLDADESNNIEDLLPKVNGFREKDESLLSVIISHPHQDHFGLISYLRRDLPIAIGEAAQKILETASLFSPVRAAFKKTSPLKDRQAFSLGWFRITPYLMDHSAFDSYSLLVEAGGKRLFYSGDFRAHGRKSAIFDKLISNPPENIDVLLMEGTVLGRNQKEEPVTEDDLVFKFYELFRKNQGFNLVWSSPQNIDRLVTIYKACKKAGKQLIIDLYAAEILRATGNDKIPQGTWNDVRVYLPEYQRRDAKRKSLYHIINRYRSNRIFPENLAQEAPKSVLLFRPKMAGDLEAAHCLKGAQIVYSLWKGYLDMESQRPFQEWRERNGIPMTQLHTSGHASYLDLKRFAEALNPKILVPIHTFNPREFTNLSPKVEQKRDGEWWEI